jgi:hypothetical protein
LASAGAPRPATEGVRVFEIDSDILQMRVTARIVEDPRGGPIRRIINGRHHKPTGRYASTKARRSLPWEDIRELRYFYHCEADSRVLTYLAQPHRIEILVGRPRPLVYFPDIRRDLADGAVEIREVKRLYDPESDPDYDLKLGLAREVYRGLGWSFDIVEAATIEHPVTLRTVEEIQRNRDLRITAHHVFAALDVTRANGGAAPLAMVADALGGGLVGEALVHALVVRRYLSVDITKRLGPSALVAAVEGSLDAPRPRA